MANEQIVKVKVAGEYVWQDGHKKVLGWYKNVPVDVPMNQLHQAMYYIQRKAGLTQILKEKVSKKTVRFRTVQITSKLPAIELPDKEEIEEVTLPTQETEIQGPEVRNPPDAQFTGEDVQSTLSDDFSDAKDVATQENRNADRETKSKK